jgi:DNA-binding response OmpR family regulator
MKRILLADDEPHISRMLCERLTREGFEVVCARDGEEAWELAQEQTPDLVVTDLQMPVMSGLDLAKALRGHGPTAKTPLIMLTARGYVVDGQERAEAGITEMHPKPFSVRHLVERVRALLGVSGAREAA